MQDHPLVIITTRLPPQICGVGTFSWLLHRHWSGDNSQDQFLVVNGARESQDALRYSRIAEFGGNWQSLARALERASATDVLMHYAGRGYQRLGCPLGLPAVLRNWKRHHPEARLIVLFHELPGPLPFTSRH